MKNESSSPDEAFKSRVTELGASTSDKPATVGIPPLLVVGAVKPRTAKAYKELLMSRLPETR